MKAAVLDKFKEPLAVKEVSDPELTSDGIILKLKATGVCRSDWHAWEGEWNGFIPPLPHILGHEMSGTVEEVGKDIKNFKKGDRVIVPFTQGDGTCPHCLAGHSNVCNHQVMPGFTYNGGFAQYTHIPNADRNLMKLPEGVDFLEASAMGCRFMTAFHGVTSRGKVAPGEWVAIFGAGGVGLSATQIATAIGANVIAVDIADDKLEFAKKVGAVATVNSKKENAPEAIKELTHGGAQVGIDALGIQATMLNSVLCLDKRGRHVQIGMTSFGDGGMMNIPLNEMVSREIQFSGSFGMPISEYPGMLQMVEKKRLQPGKLVKNTISLNGIDKVFHDMTNFAGLGVTVITDFD
ncbi:zinc-dependent alcohol dehydrogenase family protein [Sporolactobacillus inulinus]|uniref:Alcohol dehydrogenase n=1 Tax=Sporolactobacillus inulinus CASD TaxID=1069536 RepID=A0A0U1QNE7_9BACL|nr:zinc-dependent alcohol dehydrogenase family protein [Sporolactobacillus inulinus]KLI02116.1 alcohol dehydrogenase [Sporolactobacillus inulinus CASD]GEB77214.1 alcohol dehydrogenase [Sporolactobacillus inulinus]